MHFTASWIHFGVFCCFVHRLAALLHAAAGQQRDGDSAEGRPREAPPPAVPKPSRVQLQAAAAAAASSDPDLKCVVQTTPAFPQAMG